MASTKKKVVKKSAPKKVAKRKAPAKKAAKKTTRRAATPKQPEMIDYTITQVDLDTNTEYLAAGYEVGQVIQIPKPEGEFHVKVQMNDQVFEIDTDELAEAMLSLKPDALKTKVIINVTHVLSKKTAEFVLFNMKAKRLFALPLAAMGFEKSVRTILNVKP